MASGERVVSSGEGGGGVEALESDIMYDLYCLDSRHVAISPYKYIGSACHVVHVLGCGTSYKVHSWAPYTHLIVKPFPQEPGHPIWESCPRLSSPVLSTLPAWTSLPIHGCGKGIRGPLRGFGLCFLFPPPWQPHRAVFFLPFFFSFFLKGDVRAPPYSN